MNWMKIKKANFNENTLILKQIGIFIIVYESLSSFMSMSRINLK